MGTLNGLMLSEDGLAEKKQLPSAELVFPGLFRDKVL